MPLYAGLMSGTSLDGIGTAFADISVLGPDRPRFAVKLRGTANAPYLDALRARLQTVSRLFVRAGLSPLPKSLRCITNSARSTPTPFSRPPLTGTS